MAKDNDNPPLSEDSATELTKNVLKGKARKFVLIVKGGSVQTFVVFKKGAFGSKITAAKKAGFSGEATCGVIRGKGMQAELLLAGNEEVAVALGLTGSEVCEKEPCKPEKLRTFLKEAAELKLQPSFEVVTQASSVKGLADDESEQGEVDADDASSQAPPQPRGQQESEGDADESDESPPKAPPVADDAAKQKLVDALKKMVPVVQQAIGAQPGRKDELLAQVNAAKTAIDSGKLADATAALKTLGAALQAKGSQGGGAAFDAKKWEAAKKSWQDALDTVDKQVTALQKELLKTGDGDLKEIAEFGLNGITGNHKVPLLTAIREVDGAAPDGRAKAANQALTAIGKFEDHINRDARVRACDSYAAEVFKVNLAIADTLGPALEEMRGVLETSVSA